MLEVRALETFYGASQALFAVDLDVKEGEIVTLMGRNGMGKTTTLNSIMGLVKPRRGEVLIDGEDITGEAPYRIARRGIGLVPEGRQVFGNLSVRENLVATARGGASARWTVERILSLFPSLAARVSHSASVLSGGEQQMLAIGRALMTNPRLMILDEATEGLAPLIREEIWRVVGEMRADGIATILVDKNIGKLMALADRHLIVEKGRVVFSGDSRTLQENPDILGRYLGI
jgi:branched-chain amino acid transport system ATP-binding protein